MAAGLIVAESWRSSRSESKRREGVADSLDDLRVRLDSIETRAVEWEERAREAQDRCVVYILACEQTANFFFAAKTN